MSLGTAQFAFARMKRGFIITRECQWEALIVLGLLGTVCLEARAQRCLIELGDTATVSVQLTTERQPSVVLDIAARYGELVVPALRKVSKPERPIESPEGAAQAALAKLGDKTALEELRQELEGTHVRWKDQAIRKLAFAGNPEAISILVSFLLNDNCEHCLDLGDTSEDPRILVHKYLTMILPNPPIEGRGFGDEYLPAWEAWWRSNRGHITLTEPHRKLADPELRCLAVRAEWNSAEAVALLAEEGGTPVIPVLRDLVQLGYKDEIGNFSTVRGAARTTLAMLGDRSEFDAIVQELKSSDYVDALFKLRYIGTRQAVDAVTMNIGEIGFITSDRLVPSDYKAQVERHRSQFMTVLAQMTKKPPLAEKDSYTDEDVEIWTAWWAKNRDHAELALSRTVR